MHWSRNFPTRDISLGLKERYSYAPVTRALSIRRGLINRNFLCSCTRAHTINLPVTGQEDGAESVPVYQITSPHTYEFKTLAVWRRDRLWLSRGANWIAATYSLGTSSGYSPYKSRYLLPTYTLEYPIISYAVRDSL